VLRTLQNYLTDFNISFRCHLSKYVSRLLYLYLNNIRLQVMFKVPTFGFNTHCFKTTCHIIGEHLALGGPKNHIASASRNSLSQISEWPLLDLHFYFSNQNDDPLLVIWSLKRRTVPAEMQWQTLGIWLYKYFRNIGENISMGRPPSQTLEGTIPCSPPKSPPLCSHIGQKKHP